MNKTDTSTNKRETSKTIFDTENVEDTLNSPELHSENELFNEEEFSRAFFASDDHLIEKFKEHEQNLVNDIAIDDVDIDLAPAWIDEDDELTIKQMKGINKTKFEAIDENRKYTDVLRDKYIRLMGTPSWASLKNLINQENNDEISAGFGYLKTSNNGGYIRGGDIQYQKVADVNCDTRNEGIITVIEFHPSSTVALIAGTTGVASLHTIEGNQNKKLHSVHLGNFKIFNGKFSISGEEALFTIGRNTLYAYNLMQTRAIKVTVTNKINSRFENVVYSPDGKYIAVASLEGNIHILSESSKETIFTFYGQNRIQDLKFTTNSNHLISNTDNSEVLIWNMNMRKMQHKFIDEGCVCGTKLDISPSNQFLATGSNEGVVNIYNLNDVFTNAYPSVLHSCMNLTTSISDLKFNSSSELLGFSSNGFNNGDVRLYHLQSGSVYKQFPKHEHMGILEHVTRINFSPNSGYFAVGNTHSKVSLFRFKHYTSY